MYRWFICFLQAYSGLMSGWVVAIVVAIGIIRRFEPSPLLSPLSVFIGLIMTLVIGLTVILHKIEAEDV